MAGSVVREQGQGVDDVAWRREATTASEDKEEAVEMGDGAFMVVAGPPMGTVSTFRSDQMVDDTEMSEVAPGDWDVACERKRGNRLVFDRGSVRELGKATLFRWSAPTGAMPDAEDVIYTAVADCRAKSLEASWPGKRTQTRAGTCGRHLVEAACEAVQSQQQAQAHAH